MNSSQISDVAVYAALIPSEGPKAIPLTFDFTTVPSDSVDLSNMQQRGVISAVQSLFVDNASNAVALTISVNGSQQRIIVPPNAQGYFPILVPSPIKLAFSMTGATVPGTQVFLLNFPVSCLVWDAVTAANTYTESGSLIVSDSLVDGCVQGTTLQTLTNIIGNAGVPYPSWLASVTKIGAITASAANILAGNPGYFIRSISLSLSPGATLAVAGDFVVSLHDSSAGDFAQFVFAVPSTAPTIAQATAVQQCSAPDFVWNNKANNSNLSVNLSAALTAGKLYYTIEYGTTAIVG